MERLILLRHGKAENEAPSGEDFDRALTERGRHDSALVGLALAQAGFSPDIVIVSPAARARQTWEAMAYIFPGAEVVFDKALYNAEPNVILASAEGKGGDEPTVMVVAHNPGLHQLALMFAHRMKDAPDRTRLNAGFPTGAAAAFNFKAERFVMLTPKALGGGS